MLDKIVNLLGGGILTGASEIIGKFVTDPTVKAKIEAELALKEAEYRRLILEAETNDRDSARKREMEVKDRTPSFLAYGYTIGYFATLFWVGTHGVPESQQRIFDVLLGTLSAAQIGIIGYYFGSSHGSEGKTSILDRIVNHKK